MMDSFFGSVFQFSQQLYVLEGNIRFSATAFDSVWYIGVLMSDMAEGFICNL